MIGCPAFVNVILIFFGALLLLDNLDVTDNLVGRYWPVILIILGILSLFNMFRLKVKANQFRDRFRDRFGGRWPPDIDR